ncbi:MAG: hypothetical protein HKN16_06515 [Saprospiraceae bacterium]|nr:hypothetical protein [Saprospiraceae bacterium]
MRRTNPGSIFFFIFVAMMLNGMGVPLGALIPIFVFLAIANTANRQKKAQRKRGHVRESTKRRRAERPDYQRPSRRKRESKPLVTRNPFKKSGVDKFKDYDYDGAIEDFKRALQIEQRDKAVHFNLACAYSLTEQKDLAFEHLANAVSLGFNDYEKIKSHDALAFLRIQDEFESFIEGNYRWPVRGSQKTEKKPMDRPDLLQQLNQLEKLRDKGLLSKEEFAIQRKKLLG